MEKVDNEYGTGLHPRTGKNNPLHFEFTEKGADHSAANAIKERLARQKTVKAELRQPVFPVSAGWSFLYTFMVLLLWVAFAVFMGLGVDTLIFRILNVLSFGMGGAGRGVFGLIGGCIGKAAYISALCTLAGGGASYLRAGVSKIFTREYFEDKKSIILYIVGVLGGLLLYWFFTGGKVYGLMAGVAGAVIALRNLGGLRGSFVVKDALSAGFFAGFVLSIPVACVFAIPGGFSFGPEKISLLSAVFTGLGSAVAAVTGVIGSIMLSEERSV
ncbi:MAG: hypothetical protein K5770_10085 [Lachnospiraceae bacterium]|nr:hypothetical protein [Lachnospiraceae bacterium]